MAMMLVVVPSSYNALDGSFVCGNYWKGKITVNPKGGNNADVIFTPQNGDTRRFSGPVVPVAGAKYTKRLSPK